MVSNKKGRDKVKEFKINDFISVKLERNKPFIYIKGKRFIQCMRLVLNIPVDNIDDFNPIDSIDEAADHLENVLSGTRYITKDVYISPEQEFMAHCSNLQAWADNNYDTRLLHRNLAFPLLKALVQSGDLKAREIYKQEIGYRISSGYVPVIIYLIKQNYLESLDDAEIKIVLDELDFDGLIIQDPKLSFWILSKFALRGIKGIKEVLIEKVRLFLEHGDEDIRKFLIESGYYKKLPIDELKASFKKNIKIWCDLADHYYLNRDNFKAIELYKEILKSDPSYKDAWLGIAKIRKIQNDNDLAVEAYEKAVEIDSNNANLWIDLGTVYYFSEENDLALEAYEKALSLEPDSPIRYKQYGDLLMKLKHFENAIDAYEKAIEMDGSNRTYKMVLSVACRKSKKFDKALKILKEYLLEHSNDITGWINLGNVYNDMGDLNVALKCWTIRDYDRLHHLLLTKS